MTYNLDDEDVDIDLIEKYHRGDLAGAELEHFLNREKADKDFALKVRSYTEIMEGIVYYGKQQEFAQTILEWEKEIKGRPEKNESDEFTSGPARNETPVIPITRKQLFWLSAAASVAFITAFLIFFRNENPEKLADNYIETNLATLSTTMGDTDSLAIGISAYNAGDYTFAERIFRSLADNQELAPEVAEYLGMTYLISGEYDKAIAQFRKLISYTELHVNPGKFYLAVALMKRSEQGDVAEARKLLEEVVAKKLPGHEEASGWLKRL